MKKILYVLFAMLFALLFFACGPKVEDAGYASGSAVNRIKAETKQGVRYGAKSGERITIPPIFTDIEGGVDMYTVFVSPDNQKTWSLFHGEGVEILSGRVSGGKELGFEPLPIVIGNKELYQNKDAANVYYGKIFCCGDYFLFDLADGRVSALFLVYPDYQSYGPFKKFHPGCSGFGFMDNSGKWGVTATQTRENENIHTPFKTTIAKTPLASNERFDQVIEVVKSKSEYIWFVRNGEQWRAFKIDIENGRSSTITEVAVDAKLLGRVLKMPVRSKAKGRTDFDIATNQRVGTEGASTVFL